MFFSGDELFDDCESAPLVELRSLPLFHLLNAADSVDELSLGGRASTDVSHSLKTPLDDCPSELSPPLDMQAAAVACWLEERGGVRSITSGIVLLETIDFNMFSNSNNPERDWCGAAPNGVECVRG